MSPSSWTKSPTPVFTSSPITGVYGPGHNSFTLDEQGRDVLVYHGRDYEKISGDPLYDPNRHTRVQRIYYHADGRPDFGIPVGNGPVPDRFSPADRPNQFVLLAGDRLTIGTGSLPATQIRQRGGFAGSGTVSLEPILTPGRYLRRLPSGEVVLAANDGSPQFAEQSSFRRVTGLADRRGLSFVPLGSPTEYLWHVGGVIGTGEARSSAERAAATFLLS